MLLGLKISNIAVIEEVEVSFAPGLTVLTGETGAGKSILIDSLGLLLGARGALGFDGATRFERRSEPAPRDRTHRARKSLRQWRAGHGRGARSRPAWTGGYQRSA